MKTAQMFTTTDQMEITLYNACRHYHGFFEEIAHETGGKALSLRQAMNPNYHDRPSFVARTASLFIAWLHLHPKSGTDALHAFVLCILTHVQTMPVRKQMEVLEARLRFVKGHVGELEAAIDSLPRVMLAPAPVEKVRKPRTSEGAKRRSTARLKQPSIL
jgi:hypothetical protein